MRSLGLLKSKGCREYAGGVLKSLECSVLPLIKTLPSRPAPRDTQPCVPRQGKIMMPASPPSCLPGTEIKVIMEIQTVQSWWWYCNKPRHKQLWLWGADSTTALHSRSSTSVAGKEFAPVPFPASGEPATAFFSSGVDFPLAWSWPTGAGWVRTWRAD